jgi:hypothetical protein
MKNLFILFFFVVSTITNSILFSQVTENFQSWTSRGTYGTYSQSTSYGTVNMTQTIVSPTASANGVGSVGLVQLSSSSTNGGTNQGKLTFPSVNTCETLSVTIRSSGASGDFFLEKSTNNGVSWSTVQSFSNVPLTGTLYNISVNEPSSSVILRINGDNNGGTRRAMYIHDINITPNNNTNCSTVTSLSLPTTVGATTTTGTQTTCGKNNDFPVNSFGSSLYGDGEDAVWSITVPSGGGNYQFDLGGSGTYKILSLHTACTPSNANVLTLTTTSSGTSGTFSRNLAAGTYYLWTDTWPSPDCGQYSITVTKLADPPPPPSNDNPSGATLLTVNDGLGYVTYTNVGSTLTTGEPDPGCASLTNEDVWFKVVVPNNITILDFDTQTGGITDGGMAIYRGVPGSLTLIECDDDDALDGLMPWIYREDFTPGETIYIRFWEYAGGTTGTFKIFVSTPTPLPVDLLYFEGARYPTFNNLKWATASEQNSSHFDIEKSEDGENWRVVGVKSSAGNSQSLINYYYLDYYNQDNTVYYRLVQYDIDGQYEIYGPISIEGSFSSKKIVKYINLAGQEVNETFKGVVLEVYEDGTMRKIIR